MAGGWGVWAVSVPAWRLPVSFCLYSLDIVLEVIEVIEIHISTYKINNIQT